MILAVLLVSAGATNSQFPVPIELILEEPMIIGQAVTDGGERYRNSVCEEAYVWNKDYYERIGKDPRTDGYSYSNFEARVEVLLSYRKVPAAYHHEVTNWCNFVFHKRLYASES